MIKKLTASELGRCLSISPQYVTMAIKRKALKRGKDKKIDLEDPINALWLKKQESDHARTMDYNQLMNPAKKSKPILPKNTTENNSRKPKNKKSDDEGETENLAIQKIKAEIAQKESVVRLNSLKEQKAKGELIPYDEASHILQFMLNEVREGFLQEVDSAANVYKDRFDITHKEYIEIKENLRNGINENYTKTIQKLQENLESIQKKYMEVRGRGESIV